jgi:uncharacterized protein YbjT (DUF2867 family)
MIAVMGAAGHVGGQVAELLLQRNQAIRLLEHRRLLDALRARGAQVVTGDGAGVSTLRRLFDGADAALVLLPEDLSDPAFVATRSRIARSIADALAREAVGHVVALSAMGADRPDVAGPPAGLRELEQRLFALTGVNVLALRSALYMDYLLASLPLIESQGINGSAVPGDVPVPMIATRDVASEAAERLVLRDFTGSAAKLLLGPEEVSMREATEVLGAQLGRRQLPYVQFPPEQMRGALTAAGMSAEAASQIVDMQIALGEGRPFQHLRRTPESTTPTRLRDFLADALGPVEPLEEGVAR